MPLKIATIVILAITVAFCCILLDNVNATSQQITFYEEFGCRGRSQTYFSTQNNLNTTWVTNAFSYHAIGIWKTTIGKKDLGEIRITFVLEAQPPDGRCLQKQDWNQVDWINYTIKRAERVGVSDTAVSEVQLFSRVLFDNLVYTVSRDDARLGRQPLSVRSFCHFSNDTWTVYPKNNFTGVPSYIRPKNITNRDTCSYETSTELIVGSIKKGEHKGEGGGGRGGKPNGSFKVTVNSFILIFAAALIIKL